MCDDLNLITSRHRAVFDFHKTGLTSGFVPVRTSLGRPRFMPESRAWPYVSELAPHGLFHIDDPDVFRPAYRSRLDQIGVEQIAEKLHAIAVNYPGYPLALLCFENVSQQPCHRTLFAEWWQEQTGVHVEERNNASELPSAPWVWQDGSWQRTGGTA